MYKSEDCGIFIGLTTMPLGKGNTFYRDEIEEGIFANYRQNLEKYFKKTCDTPEEERCKKEFKEFFYRPKAYCLLGNYDLAVFSLIDEFSLGSRAFHPYSSLGKANAGSNFSYQTISGTAPNLSCFGEKRASLLNKSKQTFLYNEEVELPAESVYPFIGICSIKMNNALLIGTGGKLQDLTIRLIRDTIEKDPFFKEGNLDYLLISSMGWQEITIVFFSNRFKLITNNVLNIRELCVEKLKEFNHDNFYEFILKNTLLSKETPVETLIHTPLFSNTTTIFGYDYYFLEQPDAFNQPPKWFKKFNAEELKLYTRWYIKPGHLEASLGELPSTHYANISIGRGDYVYAVNDDSLKTLADYVQQLMQDPDHPLASHINKIYSTPEVTYPILQIPKSKTGYNRVKPWEKLVFSTKTINQTRQYLKGLRVAKILRDKVLNMYVSFNDCIQDEVLYAYFVDLYPYLRKVQLDIELYGEDDTGHYDSIKVISKELRTICDDFEKAHRNRFHQSHLTSEITDYNLEFNGGIQQIVTSFDSAYKTIAAILGSKPHELPFVYITGYSSVASKLYNVQLNSYHLYQPEFFVAVATHEAANNIIENLTADFEAIQKIRAYYEEGQAFADYPKAIGYFLVDLVTYYLAYNKNTKLFLYWHWGTFMQTALYYDRNGKVNRRLFQQFLLRMSLLLRFLGKEEALILAEPPCEQLAEYWAEDFEKYQRIADYFLKEDSYLKDWWECSEIVANKMVIDDFCGISEHRHMSNNTTNKRKKQKEVSEILQTTLFEQNQVRDTKSYLRVYHERMDREVLVMLGRYEELEYLSDEIVEAFKRREVYNPKPFNVLHSSSFKIQVLFYAYLKLLYELNDGKIQVLHRDEKGEPMEDEKGYDHLLFDSTGGVFTRNYALRRTYFAYRALLLQSIWQIGYEYKKKLFEVE